MGGTSSHSLLCCRVSAQLDVFLLWAKETLIGCYDAGSWIFGVKHETTKNVLQDFYSG